jgi:hypothetical protein
MLYLITLKIGIIIGWVGSFWCSTLALLKSKEMLACNAEACVKGFMYLIDTQVSIINEI